MTRELTNTELADQLELASRWGDWPLVQVVHAVSRRLRELPDPEVPVHPRLLVDVMRDFSDAADD